MKCERLQIIAASVVLAAVFGFSGAGCDHGGVYVNAGPAYAPAPAYYDYYYYPDTEVYYYPSGGVWWWHDHDAWRSGRELPRGYDVHRGNHVSVRLNTDRPYTMHAKVQAEHPRHWGHD